MKPKGLLAVIVLAALSAGSSVIAQPASPPAPGAMREHQGGPGRADHGKMGSGKAGPAYSAEDRAAFLDARIAAVHAGLKLTPEQEKLWPPAEAAARDMVRTMGTLRDKMHADGKPADPLAAMRSKADMTIARGEGMKKLLDSAGPLYATLTGEQKNRLSHLMHMSKRERMHSWMMRHDKSDDVFGQGMAGHHGMGGHHNRGSN